MLDSHWNSNKSVIGRWDDVQSDNGSLSGLPVFDSEDESAALIEGKVERGFIKSCSMGVRFQRDDMKFVNDVLVLEKCELYEVSIVAVPSNANAIRLYVDDNTEPLKESEIQTLCLSALPVDGEVIIPNNLDKTDMKKITLTVLAALALGFKENELEHDVDAVNEAAVKLQAKLTAAELKLEILQSDADAQADEKIKNKVALAIKANPTLKAQEEKLLALGKTDEALLDSTLALFPAKKSLNAQIVDGKEGEAEVKTVEGFMKLDLEAQLAFKADEPEAYNKLFTKN
ncbi:MULTISPECIES: HK97 family phage prohead protease [Bizionia]|nr:MULTISPECIES: HK97 family phage prohead protease [Bizionia]